MFLILINERRKRYTAYSLSKFVQSEVMSFEQNKNGVVEPKELRRYILVSSEDSSLHFLICGTDPSI